MKASEWIVRWTHLLRANSRVLDLACGSGRHLRWFADQGHSVLGMDRDIDQCGERGPSIALLQADIEAEPWPLQMANGTTQTFDAVVVTNYLWRPLFPRILQSVAPGGVLLYETFAAGNQAFGRPARPDFLLQPQELLKACCGLHVVAYENGLLSDPHRAVQRIAAVRPPNDATMDPSEPLYAL